MVHAKTDLTSRLKKGDLVYYNESVSDPGEPSRVVAPDFKKTGNSYPARMLGIYSPSSKPDYLAFEPRILLSLWNYERLEAVPVPGIRDLELSGIQKGYGGPEVHISDLMDIAIGPEGLREKLIPALKEDRDLALERIKEVWKQELVLGRYHKLIKVIENLPNRLMIPLT